MFPWQYFEVFKSHILWPNIAQSTPSHFLLLSEWHWYFLLFIYVPVCHQLYAKTGCCWLRMTLSIIIVFVVLFNVGILVSRQ